MQRLLRPLLPLIALALSACTLSLAQDVTPPPGSELGPDSASTEPVVFASEQVDLNAGATVYTQSCAPCHGASGLGDGEQSGELPAAVAPIGDPELAGQRSPVEWFRIVTSGNIDNFMPPFSAALNSQERWEVLAYAYSLGWDAGSLAEGEALYYEYEDEWLALFPNMADRERVLELTRDEIEVAVTSLVIETGGLRQNDIGPLATYVQARALGAVDPSAELAAQEAPESETGDIEGTASFYGEVSNGSGEELPEDLQVNLHSYENLSEAFVLQAEVAVDGSFVFDEVDLVPGRVYFASVDYLGLSYFSDFITPEEGQSAFDVPLVVYETTADTSDLIVDRVHLVVEFPAEERARIVQLVTISNRGLQAVAPPEGAGPLLFYSLPAEASNPAFEQGELGERYLPTEDGFGDLRAVLPGQSSYQILFAYDLPYGRGLEIDQQVQFDTQDFLVFVPGDDIELQGQEFVLAGDQEIDGVNFFAYQIVNPPDAGDTVHIELSGSHPLGGNPLRSLAADDEFLIGLAGLTLAVAVVWLWLRRGNSSERILDQIVTLDDRYADGNIAEDLYSRRRAALKNQLREALQREKKR